MHGRITAIHGAGPVVSGCEDCLLSPECPACIPGGIAVECDIEIAARILHRGDRLFDHDEPFDSLHMVRSGTVKTCTVSASGEEQVLGFHTSGDLLGLDAIQARRHVSSAVAVDTVSVCTLPYEPLCRLSARSPRLQGRLLAKMSQRIRDDGRRLGMLAMRSAGQRMASFLVRHLDHCRGRGLRCDEILLPMPRADIAGYLVLAVETVSRSLTRQQEEGMIAVRGSRIRILDEPALRAAAGEVIREAAPAPVAGEVARDAAPATVTGEAGQNAAPATVTGEAGQNAARSAYSVSVSP